MRFFVATLALAAVTVGSCGPAREPSGKHFVGSASCRGCHEHFYELWAPSHHGRAMQAYTAELAVQELSPQRGEVAIGKYSYRADIGGRQGAIVEKGPEGEKRLPIVYVMGGKDVYYFLTRLERGRLQTLPLAYDVHQKAWFDTAASGVRQFSDIKDAPLDWTDRPYTFNTSCYGCHVSQLTINYDLRNDTYATTWNEPGINCETCHGPASEHISYCKQEPEACKDDPRLIVTRLFSVAQTNSNCGPCHAKMSPISDDFRPGDRYFDHYDLITLEHRDFYPDGRDLGENYTFTTWRMSPCAKSGKLDCVDCHTSSGRFRFAGEKVNDACLPCHSDKVSQPAVHSHHPAGSRGSQCVACHMPKTNFARMVRSDHSMRAPVPAATLAFGSPNACNLCHSDHDAKWAEGIVRRWYPRGYEKPILHAGRLIDEARKRDWSRLGKMLDYLRSPDRDEVFANSLVRLLRGAHDDRIWPAMLRAAKDPSPLIRSSVAETLGGWNSPDAVKALIEATRDDYRLVRIRAAAALARLPLKRISPEDRASIGQATGEFLTSMRTRPDDDSAYTNLGNYYMNNGDLAKAIQEFETAVKLNPMNVASLVNLSLAYNLNGENAKAERSLRLALETEPENAAANFNLGLLLGEMGRKEEAKTNLRRALKADPRMAAAAYNLCVLEGESSPSTAVTYCRQAAELRPEEPKYGYTLGYYLAQGGDTMGAAGVLESVINHHPSYRDAYGLLTEVYRAQGNLEAAAATARRAQSATY